MNIRSISMMLVFATTALPAFAQSEHVLKGKEITERALVDALTPPPPRTRSFAPDLKGSSPVRAPSQAVLITFETNATTLTPQAERELDIVAGALKSQRLKTFHFVLEGHADVRGDHQNNKVLSLGRAEAVRDYLVHSCGVGEDRLEIVGKGDSEPLNRKDPAAPENRRVNFRTIVD